MICWIMAKYWSLAIVLVQKKDGGVRFCIDFCKLNQPQKDAQLLPRIDETHLTHWMGLAISQH